MVFLCPTHYLSQDTQNPLTASFSLTLHPRIYPPMKDSPEPGRSIKKGGESGPQFLVIRLYLAQHFLPCVLFVIVLSMRIFLFVRAKFTLVFLRSIKRPMKSGPDWILSRSVEAEKGKHIFDFGIFPLFLLILHFGEGDLGNGPVVRSSVGEGNPSNIFFCGRFFFGESLRFWHRRKLERSMCSWPLVRPSKALESKKDMTISITGLAKKKSEKRGRNSLSRALFFRPNWLRRDEKVQLWCEGIFHIRAIACCREMHRWKIDVI